MSSLIWVLLWSTGFATYEAIKTKGFDRISWGILAILFGMYALVLIVGIK